MYSKWTRTAAVLVTVAVVAGLVAFSCAAPPTEGPPTEGPPTEGPPKTLSLGMIAVMTGPGAAWGMPMSRGMEVAVDKINAEGGVEIGGQKYLLEAHAEDSKYDSEGAATAARKLVERYKVKFILGPLVTHTTLPIYPITTPAKVPNFATCWSSEVLTEEAGGPYSFKSILSPHEAYPAMLDYILSTYPETQKVGLLSVNSMSGIYGAELMVDYAESIGLEVVADELYEYGVTDYYPYLARVLAEEPDLIFTGASAPPAWALIIKQAREIGYEGKFMMVEYLTEEIMDIAGPAADGLIISEAITWGTEVTPEMKAFRDEYVRRHGEYDPFALPQPYPLLIMLEAYKMAGTIDDPDAVMQILETTTFYPFGQEARFGDGGGFYEMPHQLAVPIYLLEIKGGERTIGRVISIEEQIDVAW